MGEDGQPIADLTGDLNVTRGTDPDPDAIQGENAMVPMAFVLQFLPIPAPGVYSLNVLVNGAIQWSTTFRALLVKPSTPSIDPSD